MNGDTNTQLPLERFANIIGYSPILFNQVVVPNLQDAFSCSDPVLEYTWQQAGGGRPGREDVRLAIEQAELAIEREAFFNVGQKYHADQIDLFKRGVYNWQIGARTKVGYLLEAGVEAWSLIEENALVIYTDLDNDGYKETASATVTLLEDTALEEIVVYYPGYKDTEHQIRPLTVTDNTDGTVTIRFYRHQVPKLELQEALNANAIDGTIDSNFTSAVDVYRHYTDHTSQGLVHWSPAICDDSACSVSEQTACIRITNSRAGLIELSAAGYDLASNTWRYACPGWWTRPAYVTANYLAGFRERHPELERAVALLALTFLDRSICQCEQFRNLQAYWRADMAERRSTPGESVGYIISREQLDNPFGTTRAGLYAWKVVRSLAVGQAVLGA